MVAPATTVAVFTADQWAQRLLALYPNSWTSSAAKLAGGILYSLFKAEGSQYTFLENGLSYVLNACRIATASDVALDGIALDYFGAVGQFQATVVRQPGEPDASLRARIYANLLQSGGTRSDVQRVVQLLTGQVPRITEPWALLDNGACDSISFCDIDTVANPARAADLALPYQALVESLLPSYGNQGNNPIYGIDFGVACDRSFIIDPQPTWFLGSNQLDTVINRVRMFNTIVWRRYGGTLTTNYPRGGTITPAAGANSAPISLIPPCNQALVVLGSTAWNNETLATTIDNGNFVLNFNTLAPGSQTADWIAAPATVPGYGLLPVAAATVAASLAIPIPGQVLLVTPNWNTNTYVTAMETGSAAFAFSNPAPAGSVLNYGSFAPPLGGAQMVANGSALSNVVFLNALTGPYQLILLPGWNTQFDTVKSSTGFVVTFSTPPPADSYFYWGVLNQPY